MDERLKTLTCKNIEKLFEESGRKDPRVEAEKIRNILKDRIPVLEKMILDANDANGEAETHSKTAVLILKYLSEYAGSAEVRRGMDPNTAEDLVRLVEFFIKQGGWGDISTRSLSIHLYNDSKRLEQLLETATAILFHVQKNGGQALSFSFPGRSFPETMISGKIIFEVAGEGGESPLVNAAGLILGLSLSSALKITSVRTVIPKEKPRVLTIENKETFHILGKSSVQGYDCCLYTSGYPNQAVSAMIKLLAAAGFCFYHAGDLDPDGILILQNIGDIAEKTVTPVRMNAAIFDRYLPWARSLNKDMLRQTVRIREDTRAIPGMADLIRRIEETHRGVEQEIIDYGENA
jgi:hypothetical protein